MKVLILSGIISIMASQAIAINEQNPPAVIEVNLTTGRSDDAAKIDLISQRDGQMQVVIDPNRCSAIGVCTRMAVHSVEAKPRVVGNIVNTDGSITIALDSDSGLTRGYYLVVTNRMNGDQDVVLEILTAMDGGPIKRLPLKPFLKVGIEK